jgi:hypothetical protein
MTLKWTTKYGLAAVLSAALIISVVFFVNPSIMPQQVSAKYSFAVMLTDPPIVPAGTTVLNLTYSDISLYVTYANGTSEWLSVGTSGTVNSFALVNMTKTIASATIPTGSSVDKVEFTIANVDAVINGTTYSVTTLSNTLVMSVANSKVNQTLSGVLIDFNPTLLEIQSVDANGNPVDYFVLAPSATATVVTSLDQAQVKVGTIVKIGQNGQARLTRVVQDFSQDMSITSASLSVNGNTTSLSVTLTNNGDITFRIFGIMLQGQFTPLQNFAPQFRMPNNNQNTIPFQINNTALVPLFGPSQMMQPMNLRNARPTSIIGTSNNVQPMDLKNTQLPPIQGTDPENQPLQSQPMNPPNVGPNLPNGLGIGGIGNGTQPFNPRGGQPDDRPGSAAPSYLALQPGQTVTLTFSGVISPQPRGISAENPAFAITPIVGNSYTIQLTGEGFQTYTVTATA